jgi:hypothetical protein
VPAYCSFFSQRVWIYWVEKSKWELATLSRFRSFFLLRKAPTLCCMILVAPSAWKYHEDLNAVRQSFGDESSNVCRVYKLLLSLLPHSAILYPTLPSHCENITLFAPKIHESRAFLFSFSGSKIKPEKLDGVRSMSLCSPRRQSDLQIQT